MKMSRTVAYAVQALMQLAAAPDKRPIACGRLAANGHMPERFLLQVLRHLVESGILKSVRGVEGGYILERDPAEVSLLEVFESFESSDEPAIPELEGLTEQTQQVLLETMLRVQAAEKQLLAEVSMADLSTAATAEAPAASDG